MKKLILNNETFEAEKIIKTDTDIIGQDSSGNELFAFRGISDFGGFSITNEDGTTTDFDIFETETQKQAELINNLILDNLNMQTQIDSLITSGLGGN